MYQIIVLSYLNTLTQEYSKILTINKMPQDSLKKYCRRIPYPKISPFKENIPSCIIVFPGENNQPLTVDDLDKLFNILSITNYTINYQMTKLLQKSETRINGLLFFITK